MKAALVGLFILSARLAYGKEPVTINIPVVVSMSATAAAGWNSCSGTLAEPVGRGAIFTTTVKLPAPLRLDVLERTHGAWQLLASWRINEVLPALPAAGHFALLLRPCTSDIRFGWADLDAANLPGVIQFDVLKTVRVAASGDARLYVAGEEDSRVPDTRQRHLERVPLRDALLCEHVHTDIRCGVVAATSDTAQTWTSGSQIRLLRVPENAELTFLETGVSILRPHALDISIQRAGNWVAAALPAGHPPNQVVMDLHAPDSGLVRIGGNDLVPPPNVNLLQGAGDPGVMLKAVIGKDDEPLQDDESIMVFLSATGPEIPVAIARNDHGLFRALQLAAGTYRLKLLSSIALSTPVAVDLGSSAKSVRFPAAPQIRGRVRAASGFPFHDLRVEIIPGRVPIEANGPKRDLADVVRESPVEEDGTFRIGVPGPGQYRVGIIANSGRTERTVTVRDGDTVVDLGDISLDTGATLRGVVAGCSGGELRLTPMPDLSASQNGSAFFDFRRVQISSDGSYATDGMVPGMWLASAKCGTAVVELTPMQFAVDHSGVVIIDFAVVQKRSD